MSALEVIRHLRRELRESRFQRTMALMTAFAAIASGFEAYIQHRRGDFADWRMWTPVWLMALTAAGALAAVASRRAAHTVLPALSVVSVIDGVIGFQAHLAGIQRMPGGWRLGQYNVVMGPPVFAPLLMSSVGVLGLLASVLRPAESGGGAMGQRLPDPDRQTGLVARIAQGEFQRGMAVTAGTFAILAGGEAYFEHLRGSFNARLMWSPVWLTPPVVAATLAAAVNEDAARLVLPAASVVILTDGLAGFVLHLRGIGRMPGGFHNLDFNLTMGPPLFAPLLFASVGALGLIASLMRRGSETR